MTHTRPTILLVSLLSAAGAAASAQQVSSNWFRDAAISPDGKSFVFAHGGDLYTVPSSGGRAIPLTISPAHESSPVWSHDGKHIAFASNRHGNDDVFVMPSTGGAATRLTFHSSDDIPSDFTTDNKAVVFASSRKDDVKSSLFPNPILNELYKVSVEGGTPEMLLTTPARFATYNADGSRMVYEDRKGYEDDLRKHHTASVARDVWMLDTRSGQHTKLTDFPGEDRDPHFDRGSDSILFLSERNGDQNVFRMPLRAGAQAEQLTRFEHHPVRDLSVADNGDAAFTWHGDIFVMPRGRAAQKLDIVIAVDVPADVRRERESSGATEFVVSPSGKEVAFVVRGDVFVTSTEFSTTRRVTDTPEQERSVDFAPDGRSIIYAGERDGSWNIYKATIGDEDELYFFSATKIDEEELIATDAEEFQPQFSPDGKKIGYLHNRTEVRVFDMESKESVVALPGDQYYSYSDGDHWFEWSPDGQWLAVAFNSRGRIFHGNIGLVAADGSKGPIDIANSGYDDGRPHFAMKGGAVIWQSDRYGERSHGSWGAESDVMAVFLTQDAYDKFRLSKEEYQLQKELDEKREKDKKKEDDAKKDEEKKDDGAPGEGDDAADTKDDDQNGEDKKDDKDEKKVDPIEIDWEGLETRVERLTPNSADLADFALSDDGDKLFYLARFERGFDLWVRDFREESTKILAKLNANSVAMQMSDDGKSIFILSNGSLSKIDAGSGERKSISFSAELDIDGHAEREHLFEHVWRQTKQKFYREDMHGVDWEFYRDQYQPKIAGITNNRDFAVMLSEILGELNASHTGGRYRPDPMPGATSTAALGVFFDRSYNGEGERIVEILENGPLDRANIEVEAGDVITHIDGVALDDSTNYYSLLDGKSGDRVRLTVRNAAGESRDVVVRPISAGAENNLLYERWVRSRRDLVDQLSNGRLGYMHIRGMNDASFRDFYSEVLGRHFDKEAIVVDTRFNGGGWLHDDLVTFLTGTNYVDLYPRNDAANTRGYQGDSQKRWTKPSIVVMSEGNYSDAHFFPWAYTELKIGDTVGMPVPGTATAVWWERLHTGDLIFGIPQVGTKGANGEYLENSELQPTHKVAIPPELAAEGRDTQIEKAVEVLLKQLGQR
jgi:Tol biopolymer transport system component/C-terminal processing protease CtpA/Prc